MVGYLSNGLIEFAPMGDNGEEFQKYVELVLLFFAIEYG